MRTTSLVAAISLFATTKPATAQTVGPLGGCRDGDELGFVFVKTRSTLKMWDTGEPFTTAMPGDELRVCRFEGKIAVVTIFSPGYGYTMPRAALDSLRPTPTVRQLEDQEEACLARDITMIQRAATAFEQDRLFLAVARRRRVTIAQIIEVRQATIRIYSQGGVLPEALCRER